MSQLVIKDLSAARGGVEVLSHVSLEVDSGETVAVLGANGAGKSTLVDAICGMANKLSGTVTLAGTDITRTAAHKIARAGLVQVSQERDLFPDMSVRENLQLGPIAARNRVEHTTLDDVLDAFPRLRERTEQRAGSLSGGEQQMLAIARALLSQPEVLMLDEPTAGLAPIMVRRVVDSIVELATRGLTLILVEQNVEVSLAVSDRLVVLRRGEQVFGGVKSELGEDYRARLQEYYV